MTPKWLLPSCKKCAKESKSATHGPGRRWDAYRNAALVKLKPGGLPFRPHLQKGSVSSLVTRPDLILPKWAQRVFLKNSSLQLSPRKLQSEDSLAIRGVKGKYYSEESRGARDFK